MLTLDHVHHVKISASCAEDVRDHFRMYESFCSKAGWKAGTAEEVLNTIFSERV